MNNSLNELEKKYDSQLNEILEKIKTSKAKRVLLQFPDGFKPYATTITKYLEEKTKSEFLIWFGTCFGACDTPTLSKELEKQIDLTIQFGHNDLMPSY